MNFIDELRIYRNKLVHTTEDLVINVDAYHVMEKVLDTLKTIVNSDSADDNEKFNDGDSNEK